MKTLRLFCLATITALLVIACGGDPDPIAVSSITATGTSFEDGSDVTSDLNGSASAVDVALNAEIAIVFDMEVDASTVTSSNISLSNDAGTVPSTVTATSTGATLKPDENLERGTQYTLRISGVQSIDEGTFTEISRTFTTEGRAPVVVPQEDNMIAYFSLDGNPDAVVGSFVSTDSRNIVYGTDRFGLGNSTATFNGDDSYIVYPDGDQFLASDDFTASFWMKTNSADHLNADGNPEGHFVLGMGGFSGFQFEINANGDNEYPSCKFSNGYVAEDGTYTSEDAFFAGDGNFADNGGWQGWDFQADLSGAGGVNAILKDRWVHVVATYDASSKTHRLYFDGNLMKGHDFNLWPDGDLKTTITGVAFNADQTEVLPELTLGFTHSPNSTRWDDTPFGNIESPTAKHFKGDLDDIRFFSVALGADEVEALYEAERN